MNGFELDVYEALTVSGIKLVPQLGCSSFRIDFAVCHPSSPGKYVLAIECDGASYHSSYTARDRDRLRQQQLEKLGWTFHRIWSTDWFLRRQDEIERTIQAYRKAVHKSDGNGTATPAPSSGTIPAATPPVPAPAGRSALSPPIAHKKSIDEYSDADLQNLLRWIGRMASYGPTMSWPMPCSRNCPLPGEGRASMPPFAGRSASSEAPALFGRRNCSALRDWSGSSSRTRRCAKAGIIRTYL